MAEDTLHIDENGNWRRESSHSMLRRCEQWDYKGKGIYMLTLTTRNRTPLLGQLREDADGAYVEPTELGSEVLKAVEGIPSFYPQVRILGKQLMPDHLHFCLYVTAQLPVHLTTVVSGFKLGCNRKYWELVNNGSLVEHQNSLAELARTEPLVPHRQPVFCSADFREAAKEAIAKEAVAKENAAPEKAAHSQPAKRKGFWTDGYHDRILFLEGQLDRMLAYMKDNPRRLMEKRKHPEWFTIRRELEVAGQTFAAIGNMHLLERVNLLQVQCSRRLTQEQIDEEKAAFLAAGRRGAVLVSPCISEGEKQIARVALEESVPLVVLLENGFAPLYKPTGRYFDACSEGRLLMLAPWEHHTDRRTITRIQCLQLNEMARMICNR